MRREAHQLFVDAEELEIFQIRFVYRIKFRFELLRRAVGMGIVHLQRAYSHESEQLAALLVPIIRSVFRQSQREVAIAAWNRREQLVMMRTIHRLEVIRIVRTMLRNSLERPFSPFLPFTSSAFL